MKIEKVEGYLSCVDFDLAQSDDPVDTALRIAEQIKLTERAQETALVVCFGDDVYFSEIGVGTAHNLSNVVRETLQLAVLSDAKGIVTLHNHPLTSAVASEEDKKQHNNLAAVLEELGIAYYGDIVMSFDGNHSEVMA